MHRTRPIVLALAAVTALILSLGVAIQPADAQGTTTTPQYNGDRVVIPPALCPTGTLDIGTVGGPTPGRICRPAGFTPIVGTTACLAAGNSLGPDYGFSPTTQHCYFTGNPAAPGFDCSPLDRANDLVQLRSGTMLTFDGCLFPILAAGGSGGVGAGTPACIESSTVQDDPAAAGLQVGNSFTGKDGVRYLIHTGGPTCKFNCESGFDINCDGKIGDICPGDFDRYKVEDARTCLSLLAAAANPSVPAIAAAAAPAPAQAIAVPVSGLAHTGAETEIASAALIMMACGAAALGARRRILND